MSPIRPTAHRPPSRPPSHEKLLPCPGFRFFSRSGDTGGQNRNVKRANRKMFSLIVSDAPLRSLRQFTNTNQIFCPPGAKFLWRDRSLTIDLPAPVITQQWQRQRGETGREGFNDAIAMCHMLRRKNDRLRREDVVGDEQTVDRQTLADGQVAHESGLAGDASYREQHFCAAEAICTTTNSGKPPPAVGLSGKPIASPRCARRRHESRRNMATMLA